MRAKESAPRATNSRRLELTTMISSLDAHRYLRAKMTACRWRAGWRSLLIRAYEDPPQAEEFVTPATRDHLIVLVTGGSCDVEVRYRNTRQRCHSSTGHIGMTAPGDAATLRWHGDTPHSTLQLHLPAATIERLAGGLRRNGPLSPALASGLGKIGPLISEVMLNLNATLGRRLCLRASCGSRVILRLNPSSALAL